MAAIETRSYRPMRTVCFYTKPEDRGTGRCKHDIDGGTKSTLGVGLISRLEKIPGSEILGTIMQLRFGAHFARSRIRPSLPPHPAQRARGINEDHRQNAIGLHEPQGRDLELHPADGERRLPLVRVRPIAARRLLQVRALDDRRRDPSGREE